MNHDILLAVLLLSPLVGFLINGFRYKKHNYIVSGTIASLAVFISFACSILLVAELADMPHESRRIAVTFFDWITAGKLSVAAGFVIDQISAIMILVITGVGFL